MRVNENELGTIIVAHPNQQHSMQLAEGLKSNGLLHSYITTVFYKKNGLVFKIVKHFSNGLQAKFQRKMCPSIEDRTHVFNKFSATLFYVLLRKSPKLAYRIYVYLTKTFGIKVAKYAIKKKVKMVIMFDYTAVSCFEYLKKNAPDIVRVLDMSSIPAEVIDQILMREEQRGKGQLYADKRWRYSKKNCEYYKQETKLADYYLSPSEFVDRSLVTCGVDINLVYRASYGVNLKDFVYQNKTVEHQDVLNFVFVGKLEAAKGITYLVDAMDKLYEQHKDFKLYVVGSGQLPQNYLDREYIVCKGYLDKHNLMELYQSMHVFVLPSLWEGKSLSVLEAMASGLSAIVSDSSGNDDLIAETNAGIVVPTQDSEAIYQAAKWYLNNKEKISEMSRRAYASVNGRDWKQYHNDISGAVMDMLSKTK